MRQQLLGLALALLSIPGTALSGERTPTTDGNPGKGAVVYKKTCVACHGADGNGVMPGTPHFSQDDERFEQSDATLLEHIRNGFKSPGSPMRMPPRGGNPELSDTDLVNALTYIRTELRNAAQ